MDNTNGLHEKENLEVHMQLPLLGKLPITMNFVSEIISEFIVQK